MLKSVTKRDVLRAGGAVVAAAAFAPIGQAVAEEKPLIAFVVNVPADSWSSPAAASRRRRPSCPTTTCRCIAGRDVGRRPEAHP